MPLGDGEFPQIDFDEFADVGAAVCAGLVGARFSMSLRGPFAMSCVGRRRFGVTVAVPLAVSRLGCRRFGVAVAVGFGGGVRALAAGSQRKGKQSHRGKRGSIVVTNHG